jgi:hypothetical protein
MTSSEPVPAALASEVTAPLVTSTTRSS